MDRKIKMYRYHCTYDGHKGEWLGIHSDGLSVYHVIMFPKDADKEVAGKILLCYDDLQIEWEKADPKVVQGGYQVYAFAEELDKYRLF